MLMFFVHVCIIAAFLTMYLLQVIPHICLDDARMYIIDRWLSMNNQESFLCDDCTGVVWRTAAKFIQISMALHVQACC